MNKSQTLLHNAISAVNSGKHTPNHVAVLRKARQFVTNNKSHPLNKYKPLHAAIAKARIPLHAGVNSRDNLVELDAMIGAMLEAKFDAKQLKMGIEVEKEHGDRDKSTDVVPGPDAKGKTTFAKIAKAHLKEIPDYYTRLAKMEKQGKKAKNRGTEVKEAADYLLGEGFVRDVATYNLGQHHPRPGKLASHMRPVGRKKPSSPPMKRYNPDTFYPSGNMMSPITPKERAKPYRSKEGGGHGGKLAVGGALATAAGAAYLYKRRQKAKQAKKERVHEAVELILRARTG